VITWRWPFFARRDAEGLTGDTRPLQANQSAYLIDATWPEPLLILVAAEFTGAGGGLWTLRWGIERGELGTPPFLSTDASFQRVVLARSVRLAYTGAQGVATAKAVAVRACPTIDAGSISLLPGAPSAPLGPPLASARGSIAVSVVAVQLAAQDASRRAVQIGNFSPAGRTLSVCLGSINPVTIDDWVFRVPPNVTLEIPWQDGGAQRVSGIWDGADAAGFATVNLVA